MESPYDGIPVNQWQDITVALVKDHPLNCGELLEIVQSSWQNIFSSAIGDKGFRIGVDIFPKPQIMGFLLHELIPLEIAARYPESWRKEQTASDKDIVYISQSNYSIELKTSSDPKHIYGNRSYAQDSSKGKKAKSGYYLTVNFEKFTGHGKVLPRLTMVRFGWIDSTDWLGQKAATGQQSRLSGDVENNKLITLFP